jgi:hypothetical protein
MNAANPHPAAESRQRELDDAAREEFLRALDASEIELTEFEQRFVGDFIDAGFRWRWTGPRRQVVEELRQRYQHRIHVHSPQSTVRGLSVPAAPEGQCGYLVRDESGEPQRRCGLPAVTQNRLGLALCEHHQQQVAAWRQGQREKKDAKLRN